MRDLNGTLKKLMDMLITAHSFKALKLSKTGADDGRLLVSTLVLAIVNVNPKSS